MEEREYRAMAAVEDRHFWFVANRRLVKDAMKAAGLPKRASVLDVGCGTGGTMKSMDADIRLVGLDLNAPAARVAAERSGRPVVNGSAVDLPFHEGIFDCVLALHVFEHIEDDGAAVREVRRVLRPGGFLVAAVPCHPWLYSHHDVALQHFRRYTRQGFLGLLERGGFEPETVAWTSASLLPVLAVYRTVAGLFGSRGRGARSDTEFDLGPLNGIFGAVMSMERAIMSSFPLPFGLNLLVVARPVKRRASRSGSYDFAGSF